MSKQYTLGDVVNLSTARYKCAAIRTPDYDVTVHAIPNSNDRGDRWHDCHAEVIYPDGSSIRGYHYEVSHRPSETYKIIARHARDIANGELIG